MSSDPGPGADAPRHGRALGLGGTLGVAAIAFLLLRLLLGLVVAVWAGIAGVEVVEAARQVQAGALGPALVQVVALGAAIAAGLRRLGRPAAEALGLVPAPIGTVLAAAIAGLALQLPLAELATVLSEVVPPLALDPHDLALLTQATRIDSPLRALTVPIGLVLVPALSEELLFRGLLLGALGPQRATAVVWTALLFGAFHGVPLVTICASLAGLFLGALALRSRSVLPAIALHAGFNAAPVLGLGADGHVPPLHLAASLALFGASYALALRPARAS